MSTTSGLLIFGGLLLAGVSVLLWDRDTPADELLPQNDPRRPGKTIYREHGEHAGRYAGGVSTRRFSAFRSETAAHSKIRRALAELEAHTQDDLPSALEKIATAWPEDDLPAAIDAIFASNTKSLHTDALRLALLNRWAFHAPVDAAAWAQSLPFSAAYELAIHQTALRWSDSDAQAAWDWVSGLEAGTTRDAALTSLAYEMCRNDPALAFDRSGYLPDGQARTQLIEHAVANWAAMDPQAALIEVKKIGDDTLRHTAIGSLASSWADSDPQAAATLAAVAMEPGSEQERAVASIVQRWAQHDPAAARAWVTTFPDGPIKKNAHEQIQEMIK
jgi:hypothetical protein